MVGGFELEVGDALEGRTQIDHKVIGQRFDEAVFPVDEDLEPGEAES